MSARALMPPPRPSNNLLYNSVHAQSRFGASSSKNSWRQRAEISTSSNTSSSRSGSSFKAGGSSSTRTGHSSNLSSNSDAHKPRRKRRPKKKKQQVCTCDQLFPFQLSLSLSLVFFTAILPFSLVIFVGMLMHLKNHGCFH